MADHVALSSYWQHEKEWHKWLFNPGSHNMHCNFVLLNLICTKTHTYSGDTTKSFACSDWWLEKLLSLNSVYSKFCESTACNFNLCQPMWRNIWSCALTWFPISWSGHHGSINFNFRSVILMLLKAVEWSWIDKSTMAVSRFGVWQT